MRRVVVAACLAVTLVVTGCASSEERQANTEILQAAKALQIVRPDSNSNSIRNLNLQHGTAEVSIILHGNGHSTVSTVIHARRVEDKWVIGCPRDDGSFVPLGGDTPDSVELRQFWQATRRCPQPYKQGEDLPKGLVPAGQ